MYLRSKSTEIWPSTEAIYQSSSVLICQGKTKLSCCRLSDKLSTGMWRLYKDRDSSLVLLQEEIISWIKKYSIVKHNRIQPTMAKLVTIKKRTIEKVNNMATKTQVENSSRINQHSHREDMMSLTPISKNRIN